MVMGPQVDLSISGCSGGWVVVDSDMEPPKGMGPLPWPLTDQFHCVQGRFWDPILELLKTLGQKNCVTLGFSSHKSSR